MKYIITGHLGQIGRELNKRLKVLGNECILEVDLKNKEDINNMNLRHGKIDQQADVFFHLASFCKINKTIEDPDLAFDNNVLGTYEILEFCRNNQIPKIIYFSSSRVLSEERNPYVASKIYGEELVKSYHDCYGIKYLIVRPSTVYGGIDDHHRLMDAWIKNAQANRDLIIYGDKDKTLTFTYIEDFINALILGMGDDNRDINIGGNEEKLIHVAEEIISQTNSQSKIVFKEPEIAQPQNVKIFSTAPIYPKTSIREGVRKCLTVSDRS